MNWFSSVSGQRCKDSSLVSIGSVCCYVPHLDRLAVCAGEDIHGIFFARHLSIAFCSEGN